MSETQHLTNLPAVIGVHKEFVQNEPATLVIKEKLSFSGDNFTIKTVTGMPVVTCSGKVMSLSGRKEFKTPAGQHLFTLRRKHLSFPKSWYLEDPNGQEFLEIKGRWTIGKAKLDAHFQNTAGDGQPAVIELRGDFFDRSADLMWNGAVIAMIRRSFFNMSEVFGDHQTYGVQVAPGADLTLIAALVVALDESQNEK